MISGDITEALETFLLLESTLIFQQAMDGLNHGSTDITCHTEVELAQKLLKF